MTPLPPAGTVWHRFVAVGDSFTEGMSDRHPRVPDSYVGWADRLAMQLSEIARGEFHYANLAVRGRLLSDIVGPQLDTALAMQPDLVSVVGGGNDILRPRVSLDAIAQRLEEAVLRIRAAGADVLLATPVDPADAPLVKATRGRVAVHAANVFSIAARHGAFLVDQWGMPALRDWRMWSEDRIHLTAEGHRRVALAALAGLGHEPAADDWRIPLPATASLSRREAAAANVQWAREHLLPWVRRRLRGESSGDGLSAKRPELSRVDMD